MGSPSLQTSSIHCKSLTFSILKLLSESLVFPRITYMLCQCGVHLKEKIKLLVCCEPTTTKLCHPNHQVITQV